MTKSKGDVDLRRELNSTDIIMLALLEQRKERRKEKQRCNRSNRKADISPKENTATTVLPQKQGETDNSTQREV